MSEPSIFFADANERQGVFVRRTFLMGGVTGLVLAGLSDSVREVFDISGFTSIFAIEPDLDSALAAIA